MLCFLLYPQNLSILQYPWVCFIGPLILSPIDIEHPNSVQNYPLVNIPKTNMERSTMLSMGKSTKFITIYHHFQ
jgi:hypothetical protein